MPNNEFDGHSGIDADYVEVDCPQFDPLWLRDRLHWFPLAPALADASDAVAAEGCISYKSKEGTDHD
jgi:hypothetical protein